IRSTIRPAAHVWERTRLTDSGSRQRLAAILAADVVGYSRLMTADEHATVAALDAARLIFRTQIESSQGRVIDMVGDSVLAVFDSATGAVPAAMAVQQALEGRSGEHTSVLQSHV